MSAKSPKNVPFTQLEKSTLKSLIKGLVPAVSEGKSSGVACHKAKESAWQKVCNEFNERHGGPHRNVKQLQECWNHLKRSSTSPVQELKRLSAGKEGDTKRGHIREVNPNTGRKAKERSSSRQAVTGNAPSAPRKGKPAPLCFDDGKRRIDFVLAYGKGGGPVAEDTRKVFEQNLLKAGLELEQVDGHVSAAEKTTFVKIHAPWNVITKYAEMLHLMMPVKEREVMISDSMMIVPKDQEKPSYHAKGVSRMESDAAKQAAGTMKDCVQQLGSRICTPWPYNRRLIPDEQEFHNAEFDRQREGAFLITDRETFFTPAMRSRIVWEVLTQTAYDERGREKGINKLLNRDIYLAAYPLHDGPCGTGPINTRVEPRTERRLLYSEWARLAVCYKEQPIQLIRRYFGVKTGLYFTWLGFYTGMLLLPAIVGILTAIYGVVMLTVNVPLMETCDPKIFGNLVLCPACKKSCPYDHLSNKCNFSKVVYLFENPATVAFSIFMALWATIFMEMWKRRQAVLKWEWKLSDLDTLSNLIKPDYEARARVYRLNPVTMSYEPYVPLWERILRISGTTSVVLLMILLALIAVFGIITYRIILTGLLLRDKQWRQFAPLTTAVTASTLNLVIILIMDRIYARIAEWLTYIEVPRTEEEYEDSYTVKMFLFNFFNTYSSLFYIAFLKGRFSRYPGNPGTLFGYSIEKCPGGCLYEVCVQLAIVMMGKQFFNHLCEIGIPFVKNWWRSRRHEKATSTDRQSLAQWEADYDLEPWTTLSLFDEYLEMAVQFGFVTLFAMAFPLAPLFAFLNNVIEIRVDAYKYTAQLRRPLAQRVPDIGSWQVIFKGMSSLAVIVNAFLIAFTSDTIPRVVYRSTYSSDFSLTGFVNFTLSVFDTSDFEEDARPENATLNGVVIKQCRYFDYREPPGEDNPYSLSLIYWQIFTARLIFVVVFEHVVFAITGLLDTIIPDVPRSVQERIKREQIVTQEVFAEYERTGPGTTSEAVPKTPVAAIQPPAE